MEQTLETETVRNDVLPDGIELDENGFPIGSYSVEEVFDRIDKKFIAHYGEWGRRFINEERKERNRLYHWKFDML
jgi:hypothetical protein